MTFRRMATIAALVLMTGCASRQQVRKSGQFQPDRKAPQIVEYADPFVMRRVEGRVVFASAQDGYAGALIELRGPGERQRIYSVRSDAQGWFQFHGLPSGRYAFECSGYAMQLVQGTIIVDPKVKKSEAFVIRLPVGV